jgi:hypothetical protein
VCKIQTSTSIYIYNVIYTTKFRGTIIILLLLFDAHYGREEREEVKIKIRNSMGKSKI